MTRDTWFHRCNLSSKRVFVAGHRGMLGSAIVRRLNTTNCEVITVGRSELDLRRQAEVENWVADRQPDIVIIAAARVGGILANSTRPAEFIDDNLAIALNLIHASHMVGTEKLLFVASSCVYPRECSQPMREEYLLTGPLEPTNESYAIAKIAGIKLCEAYMRQYGHNFISALPCNLYGPGDNFDPQTSHVIPGMIRRADAAVKAAAPTLTIWGSGNPRREFLHVDDAADACVFLLENYSGEKAINVGCGDDVTIRDLAQMVAQTVGYEGELVFDLEKPDGMPQKKLDVGLMASMGWRSSIALKEGLATTYSWYVSNDNHWRGV